MAVQQQNQGAVAPDDGGPAFPVTAMTYASPVTVAEGKQMALGMSLRDHHAGLALQGICAHPDTWGLDAVGIAERAYLLADAMLRARKAGEA